MHMMQGAFELHFQGQTCRCPLAGVRESADVEVAVATPFGLRRVIVELDEAREITQAHTFAFDYESGELTRFELEIAGGPTDDGAPNRWAGTVSGGGLEGRWEIAQLGGEDDEATEAAHALGIGAQIPAEIKRAPERKE